MRKSFKLNRYAIWLALFAAAFLCAELTLRHAVTHVVKRELVDSSSGIEANPEFLIQYTNGKRRYVPGTRVTIKNHYLSNRDIEIDINSMGLRNVEIPSPKPENEKRLLILGDSITASDYLNRDEIFTTKLQAILNQSNSPPFIRTINAGIGNTGTKEQIDLLEELAPQVQTDFVLLAFYLNDSRPPWGFAGEIGDHGWLRRHSLLFATLYRLLAQLNRVSRQDVDRFAWIPALDSLNWKNDISEFDKLTKLAKYDWGAAWQEDSWTEITAQLERLRALASQYNFRPLIAVLPVIYQLQTNFDASTPQKRMLEIARTLEIPTLDLTSALKQSPFEQNFLDHCHLSITGNTVAANALDAFLRDKVVTANN